MDIRVQDDSFGHLVFDISGSKPLRRGPGAGSGVALYCPVIVKYRDEKTAGSVTLEDFLR